MTPTTIRARPTSAATAASTWSLRIAGTLPDRRPEQGGERDARRGVDVHGPVEGGGGGRRVLEGEGPVGGELGDSDRRPSGGCLAVDLDSAARRSFDTPLDEAARVGCDRDADRGPAG